MIMMEEQETMVYTIEEAATILRVSTDTIRRMIKDKQLDAHKVRGQWRIKASSVNKYLQ